MRSGFPRAAEPPARRAPAPRPGTRAPRARGERTHRRRRPSGKTLLWTPQRVCPSPAPPCAPAPRGAGRRPRPTQRGPGEEDGAVQRPGRGSEEPVRVADEVRGALAQAAGHPDVVEAQEAAAHEGQAPAALGVVHNRGGAGASEVRVRGCSAGAQEPTMLLQMPLFLSF